MTTTNPDTTRIGQRNSRPRGRLGRRHGPSRQARTGSRARRGSGATRTDRAQAERLRAMMEDKVGLGMAAVVGLFQGVRNELERSDLPNTAGIAIHGLGLTARNVIGAAAEETQAIRRMVRSAPRRRRSAAARSGRARPTRSRRAGPTKAAKAPKAAK